MYVASTNSFNVLEVAKICEIKFYGIQNDSELLSITRPGTAHTSFSTSSHIFDSQTHLLTFLL